MLPHEKIGFQLLDFSIHRLFLRISSKVLTLFYLFQRFEDYEGNAKWFVLSELPHFSLDYSEQFTSSVHQNGLFLLKTLNSSSTSTLPYNKVSNSLSIFFPEICSGTPEKLEQPLVLAHTLTVQSLTRLKCLPEHAHMTSLHKKVHVAYSKTPLGSDPCFFLLRTTTTSYAHFSQHLGTNISQSAHSSEAHSWSPLNFAQQRSLDKVTSRTHCLWKKLAR